MPSSVLVYTPRVSVKTAKIPLAMRTNRSRIDIIADILDVTVRGAKKTGIMRNANLSHRLLEKYLEDAVGIGFLQFNYGVYETTGKGRRFLEMYVQFSSKYSRLQKDLEASLLQRASLEKMCSPPIKNILESDDSRQRRAELNNL